MKSTFYDSNGRHVAYTEDDVHIYLFSGEPVAYLDNGSVYSFSGRHLGWFENGCIRDNNGSMRLLYWKRYRWTNETNEDDEAYKKAKIVWTGKTHTIIGTGYKKRLKSNVLIKDKSIWLINDQILQTCRRPNKGAEDQQRTSRNDNKKMKIRYDSEADAMYIKFRDGEYEISEENKIYK